jgi:predicted dehydrogenase
VNTVAAGAGEQTQTAGPVRGAARSAPGSAGDGVAAQPRLGFLGLGWIGASRLQSLAGSGAAIPAALCDPSPSALSRAAAHAPAAVAADSLDALIDMQLDGIVIATPSALHAEQCIQALEHGLAVFCQKPLARTAAESRRVVDAARGADRLLGVDLSYRHTAALRAVRDAVRGGAIGRVYAADMVFHNAYAPDGAWARDPALAGGGCIIDLGIHLVDAALWVLDFPPVRAVTSQVYSGGRRLAPGDEACEDYATAVLELEPGTSVRIACSWEFSSGRPAVIEASFHGVGGGVTMRNVDGSFHDFTAELNHGASSTRLVAPPDDWGGRGIIEWSRRLARDRSFDPGVESVVRVAGVLDAMLGR